LALYGLAAAHIAGLFVQGVDGRDGETEPDVLAHQVCAPGGDAFVDDHFHHFAVLGEVSFPILGTGGQHEAEPSVPV
jgi:hypothetical protein